MNRTRLFSKRQSGVVMPIFSLPSPYGIGTFGKEAYDFVDQLVTANQKYWQILPLGHTGFGDSPYQCFSVVAGNPYFIDLVKLIEAGYLFEEDLTESDQSYGKIDYNKLAKVRLKILHTAYNRAYPIIKSEIDEFVQKNEDWIVDYALFMAVKKHFSNKPMWDWDDKEIKKRTPKAMAYYSKLLKEDIEFYYFIQYLFFQQWNSLKEYANQKGILFIGDIPMYPSPDSCDVWANRHLFKVDEDLKCYKVAGVPPDIYSKTGQLWGNPIYKWDVHQKDGFSWWLWRIEHTLDMADVIRIDHFRAFQDYWEILGTDKTALNGRWVPGPRMALFEAIKKRFGDIPIIAEDLGIIGDDVRELLLESGYPGMNVLIFGLNPYDDSTHKPHNYKINSVAYTSTHDSETFCHAMKNLSDMERVLMKQYLNYNKTEETLGFAGIRNTWASCSIIAMTMVSDLLSLEEEGRINTPSTLGGNWDWRLKPGELTTSILADLEHLTWLYKRNM